MIDEAEFPDLDVVRHFKNRSISPRGWSAVLDIGSGNKGNANALRSKKIGRWGVHTLDVNPATNPDFCIDIREFIPPIVYDVVLDCNTLCHVEDAPYQKIYDWLDGDGGWFFSVHPTLETVPLIAAGRWTRKASEWDIRESLKMFSKVKIDRASYPDPRRGQIESYIITADK